MDVERARQLIEKLKAAWNRKPHDSEEIGNLLQNMKLLLVNLSFLPTDPDEADMKSIVIARDTLEIGAFWSIETGKMDHFEHYMVQLKTYYFDYTRALPAHLESIYQPALLGLNLLYLLSENRLGDFHAELERLPVKMIENNVYISYPVKLEQNLMEGSYQKVFMLKDNVPDPHYTFFVKKLLVMIKDEIALCAEKAYEHLDITGIMDVLQIDDPRTAREYAESRSWLDTGDNFILKHDSDSNEQLEERSKFLLEQSLGYARDLERIV